jgi:hypothetical protein
MVIMLLAFLVVRVRLNDCSIFHIAMRIIVTAKKAFNHRIVTLSEAIEKALDDTDLV